MERKIKSAIFSGMLVGFGVLINTESDNRYIGAMLFSLALLVIINKKLNLYTGKIGFYKQYKLSDLLLMLLFNLIGISVIALSYNKFSSKISMVAEIKFEKDLLSIFLLSIFCGMLMYTAVFCDNQLITVFCIMTFILIGAEHCIADFPYFIMYMIKHPSISCLIKYIIIIIGNSIGSILLSQLQGE